MVCSDELAIRSFLASLSIDKHRVARIINVARESFKESRPEMPEGACLHDAHFIKGGTFFGVAKSLVTGAIRLQTLRQTLDFIENELFGRFKCVTDKAHVLYAEREPFTQEFVAELRRHM